MIEKAAAETRRVATKANSILEGEFFLTLNNNLSLADYQVFVVTKEDKKCQGVIHEWGTLDLFLSWSLRPHRKKNNEEANIGDRRSRASSMQHTPASRFRKK